MAANGWTRWLNAADTQLLHDCEIDTYRASGPGGQKRNKTSSAVRLRHRPTGIIAIAEESRSQHENKAKALLRLRRRFALELREPGPFTREQLAASPLWSAAIAPDGRLAVSTKNPAFWPAAAIALDALADREARVSDAAELLGISTGQLADFLHAQPQLWQEANRLRARFGHKPLKA